MTRRSLGLVGCVAAVAAALGGCGGGGSGNAGGGGSSGGGGSYGGGGGRQRAAPAGSARITMRSLAFAPRKTSVRVGQRVTWVNADSVDHNVTALSGAKFHSRAFSPGATFSFRPTRPGTIRYTCTLHPGMDGTLVVK